MCLNFDGLGVTLPGGFAEYVVSSVSFSTTTNNNKKIDAILSLSPSTFGFCIVVLAKSSSFTI